MEAETFYHVYNHANGSENLFRSVGNYYFFLKRFREYIIPIAETYAFCLMPNHFHMIIRIKDEKTLIKEFEGKGLDLSLLISKRFSNFFNSYAKSYNLMYRRRGSLFMRPFRVKEIKNDDYFTQLVLHIHANPVHHGFVKKIDDWPYSSYKQIISTQPTLVEREVVLKWFNGRDGFIQYHQQAPNLSGL